MTEWIPALARYAGRFHRAVAPGHQVASPLGAWLLLALSARDGDDALGEVLGVDPGRASEVAAALLAEPHPLVAAATAGWHHADADLKGLADWLSGLPPETTFGPLPDQAGLDAWARERTFGLIEQFPLTLTREVVLTLASALATKVSWEAPFDVAPAAALGGDWASRLTRVLREPDAGHLSLIARTAQAGDVIAHAALAESEDGRSGLRVVSVAAAADVEPERVMAAAYELAPRMAHGAEMVSLFDLPLGESPLWTIREERRVSRITESCTAVLPCWSATSRHDLAPPEFGFAALWDTLAPGLGIRPEAFKAAQSAMARYGRYGFEAAAVTGFFGLASMPSEIPVRLAELRFAHPYAVVAVASQSILAPGGDHHEPGPWDGVPVFSAWVSDPEDLPEADAADDPRR